MKHLTMIWLCAWLLLSCATDSGEIKQLDDTLSNYPEYIVQKEKAIKELKLNRNKAHHREARYQAVMELYRAYQDYSLDSALVYIRQALALADSLGDRERIIDTRLSQAFLYNYAGRHSEALGIFRRQNVSGCSDWLRRSYFYLGMNIYKNIAVFALDDTLQQYYRQQMEICRDSAIAYAPDDKIIQSERLSDHGQTEAAIQLLSEGLADHLSTKDAGLKYFVLSEFYEKLGEREQQKHYLVMSSIVGIQDAVREYIALRKLAILLYQEGDIERAYTYIHQCIKDASDCNAPVRVVEASTTMEVIESAMMKQKMKTRNGLIATAFVIGLLMLLLAITLLLLRRKMNLLQRSERELMRVNNQVTDANVQLRMTNKQLKEANDQVVAANKVKEEYVTRFMNLCIEYIYKMEQYRSQLNKIANKHNFKDLYEAIKSTRYINQEVSDFYNNFDEAFLHIYPNFLKDFNALLRPDAQVSPKKGERLNTELRIYALLKLGISDSTKVQEFLRCSSSTVYNYRTNMRNKAINRDTFEQDVLNL